MGLKQKFIQWQCWRPEAFFKCCLQILVQYCLPFSLLWITLIRHRALRSLYNQIKVAIVKITHHVDVCCCSPVASVSASLAVRCTLWGLAKANHAGNGVYSVSDKKRPVKNSHRKWRHSLRGKIHVTFSCHSHCCVMRTADLEQVLLSPTSCVHM